MSLHFPTLLHKSAVLCSVSFSITPSLTQSCCRFSISVSGDFAQIFQTGWWTVSLKHGLFNHCQRRCGICFKDFQPEKHINAQRDSLGLGSEVTAFLKTSMSTFKGTLEKSKTPIKPPRYTLRKEEDKEEIKTEAKTCNCLMTSTGWRLSEARAGDAWINGWMKDGGERRERRGGGQSGRLQKALVAFPQQFVFAALWVCWLIFWALSFLRGGEEDCVRFLGLNHDYETW